MMRKKLLLLSGALILTFSGSVYGTLVPLEDAYELSMSQVRLPRHYGGQLVVRQTGHEKSCPGVREHAIFVGFAINLENRPGV